MTTSRTQLWPNYAAGYTQSKTIGGALCSPYIHYNTPNDLSLTMELNTTFVGLQLRSPIIIGSSGLSKNLSKLRALIEAGAGAVVLKSLLEEQILHEEQRMLQDSGDYYTEAQDYISHYVRSEEVNRYLDMIRQYKRELDVPIIASICCYKPDSWIDFAQQIAQAGADALELNIMRVETDLFFDPIRSEELYVETVRRLKELTSLPLIVKLSRYHTALPALVDKLRAAGADAVTLFNRSYQPDIDLEHERLSSADVFTQPADFADSLRFTALVSGLVPQIEISTSGGVSPWAEVVKSLLAGASSVQMCSALYKHGAPAIVDAIVGVQMWMQSKGYKSVDELKGRLNSTSGGESNAFERVQFMRYFGSKTV